MTAVSLRSASSSMRRRVHRSTLAALCAQALLVPALGLPAQAPFNTEVLPVGAVQLQTQSQSHVAPGASGGWIWLLPAIAAGLGDGVEVSGGVSTIRPRMTGSAATDLTLAAKWRPFISDASGTAFSVGTFAFVPTSRRPVDGGVRPDGYAIAYGALSQVLPFQWGASDPRLAPQLTIAGYATVGRDRQIREALAEERGGVSFAVDQLLPVAAARAIGLRGPDDFLALSLNWVSGAGAFGYTNASVAAVHGPHAWSVGYARGNRPYRNHGPTLGYAFTF